MSYHPREHCKKITVSTDPKLYATIGEHYNAYNKELPQIPQDFIKDYCEQGGIDEVDVEYIETAEDYGKELNPKRPEPYYKWKLKLNPDNTVITHLIEEKMYSREEIPDLVVKLGVSWQSHNNFNAVDFHGERVELMKKWIKENL